MTTGRNSTAILFMTHFVDEMILGEYRKIKAEASAYGDVILLCNTTEMRVPPAIPADVTAFLFDKTDIRALGYTSKDTSISSYNIELFVINFFTKNPQYDYYWAIEYDVRFSGNWALLFDAFCGNHVDLLGTTVYRYDFNPSWDNWRSLTAPPPGVKPQDRIRAFLPIYRISRRALDIVHKAYHNGWGGHCECTIPTILNLAGLSIEDMGGNGEFVKPGNLNRFYHNNPKAMTHGPGTLIFRPVLTRPGNEPNLLWHPVKSPTVDGMITGRRYILLHKAKNWMRSNLAALNLHLR